MNRHSYFGLRWFNHCIFVSFNRSVHVRFLVIVETSRFLAFLHACMVVNLIICMDFQIGRLTHLLHVFVGILFFANLKALFPQRRLLVFSIRIMQAHIVQLFVVLFQCTQHVQDGRIIAIGRPHLFSNQCIFFFPSFRFRIVLHVDPARNQNGGERLFLISTQDASNVLNEFDRGGFRIDKYAQICTFGIYPFANGFTRTDEIDFVHRRFVQFTQHSFAVRRGCVAVHPHKGDFGVMVCKLFRNFVKGHLKRFLIYKIPYRRIAFSIYTRVKQETTTRTSGQNRTRNGLVHRLIGVFRVHIYAHVKRIQHSVTQSFQIRVLKCKRNRFLVIGVIQDAILGFRSGRVEHLFFKTIRFKYEFMAFRTSGMMSFIVLNQGNFFSVKTREQYIETLVGDKDDFGFSSA